MLHQLARFSSIAPLIREVEPRDLLDVGSGSEGVAGWLEPGCHVTALDRSFADGGAMRGPQGTADAQVVGDARELPFPDDAFDVVLALDVLEHIAPADRTRALEEFVRAARRRVIVAGPAGHAALATDCRLAAGLRARGMSPPEWLLEHEANGFPEPEEIERRLGSHGAVRLLGNENLRWHEWLFRFEFRRPGFHLSRVAARVLSRGLVSRGLVRALSRLALRVVRGPDRPPSYRTIAVLDLPA
jgi:SAM-dependent methyltransferase